MRAAHKQTNRAHMVTQSSTFGKLTYIAILLNNNVYYFSYIITVCNYMIYEGRPTCLMLLG